MFAPEISRGFYKHFIQIIDFRNFFTPCIIIYAIQIGTINTLSDKE